MPTIYEYLNSISDLLVAMDRDYGSVKLEYNPKPPHEKQRYCVTLRQLDVFGVGFGVGPATAHDAALKRLKENLVRRRYELMAEQEIDLLNDEVPF